MSIYKNFNQIRQIGEHTIYLPDPPNINQIAYKDLPQDKQFFRRTYLPNNWDSLPRDDKNKFANEQWDIRGRENEKGIGFWFMNNGNLEWMSPNHYFYTNWWRIGKVKIPKEYFFDPRDIYYPFFTDADRDWHYLTDDCFYDPHCGGLFSIEFRRGGKTYRVGCYQYEKLSKTHDAKGGIQSRDDTDSYNVFEKIIYGWRNLPPFFKPVDTGNNNPLTELVFDEPKKINTKNQNKIYSDILHSWIDYGNASKGFYDGKEQLINIQDEIGKIEAKRGIDLIERIRVVVECCFIMDEKAGMVLGTTTVEEMDKSGGRQAKELWLLSTTIDSDAKLNPDIFPEGKALNDFGFTQSKLKRYFRPAYKGFLGKDTNGKMLVDRYGYSDEERAYAHFEIKRKSKKGKALASEKRKFPLKIEDCWVSDIKNATYDTVKIEQQLQFNQTLLPNTLTRGNFMWQNGIKDTTVIWYPCQNGRFLVMWIPEFKDQNKWIIKGGQKHPARKENGMFGLDPYDNKTTEDNRASNAACYGYRAFEPLDPHNSGTFISEYVNRPELPEIMWEDMIMVSVFYGWEIMIENNKIGTINYFRMRGYYNYIPLIDGYKERGIPMSGDESRQSLIHKTESYIAHKVGLIEEDGQEPRMGRCYFDRLLNCWLEFEYGSKWTKYDEMVGAGLALCFLDKPVKKKTAIQKLNLFPTYKMVGGVSQLIT